MDLDNLEATSLEALRRRGHALLSHDAPRIFGVPDNVAICGHLLVIERLREVQVQAGERLEMLVERSKAVPEHAAAFLLTLKALIVIVSLREHVTVTEIFLGKQVVGVHENLCSEHVRLRFRLRFVRRRSNYCGKTQKIGSTASWTSGRHL
jgi:hypothetical protein